MKTASSSCPDVQSALSSTLSFFFFSIFYYSFGYDCSQIGCITATTTLFIKGQLNIDLCWEKKQKGPTEKKVGRLEFEGGPRKKR